MSSKHISELRWDEASRRASNAVQTLLESTYNAQYQYEWLLVAFQNVGNDDQVFADQLFDGVATAEQVAMVTDLRNAMVACHDMYEALHNISISTADRASQMRRMT